MIDEFFCRREDKVGYSFDPHYSPEDAIVEKNHYNPTADNLTVIFPPWHGGGKFLSLLSSRIARRGESVLSYNLHDQIVEPNIERVQQSFRSIQNTVENDLLQAVDRYGYERIRLLGMSLGNVTLALTARTFSAFDEALMVAPGSNLALSVWNGIRTQQIRRLFEEQGIGELDINEAWARLAPISHVNAFSGKRVKVLTSNKDSVIPTEYQHDYSFASAAET